MDHKPLTFKKYVFDGYFRVGLVRGGQSHTELEPLKRLEIGKNPYFLLKNKKGGGELQRSEIELSEIALRKGRLFISYLFQAKNRINRKNKDVHLPKRKKRSFPFFLFSAT